MIKKCLVCKSSLYEFVDFGKMPIANGFLMPKQFKKEYFFNLRVAFCPKCKMVQLTEFVDREKMFHENYAFYSSTSSRMAQHFKEFAISALKNIKDKDPFVIEIGSNDGIMLKNFADRDIKHLGIEPSSNVAKVAISKGIRTIVEFFDKSVAEKIIAKHGKADLFLGANVICHIPYIHSVVDGIKQILKPKGLFIFEDPYLGYIIEKTSYDQIYDEHAFFFSVTSVKNLMSMHDLELVDVIPQETHGGSMRYTIGHKGKHKVRPSVKKWLTKEKKLGLDQVKTYKKFKKNVEKSRKDLVNILKKIKKMGKRVVGYAATSKSTTINNYCGIGPDLIEFISDTTPIKQGKYSPGTHIPVKSYDEFKSNYPDYAVLFAWNHSKEIMAKEKDFVKKGGKWITFAPAPVKIS